MTTPPDQPRPEEERQRVRDLLEQELARIDSPEAAEAVLERVESLTAGKTEAEKAEKAAARPGTAATDVERAADTSPPAPPAEAAAVLARAAAQAVAPTPEAPAVVEAARDVLGPRAAPVAPETEQGRSYLKTAVLRRLGPFQAQDVRLYLAINGLPHTRWSNAVVYALTVIATGGWIWVLVVFGAYLFRVPRSWRALTQMLPSVVGATWIVEYPIKETFRRRRPFIDVVRALVIGKKPGSWSFPSGHTASSFASAWVLSTVWPRRSPLFFALASAVGFSRIYLGAHYPSDVGAGALLGTILAEILRRGARRVLG